MQADKRISQALGSAIVELSMALELMERSDLVNTDPHLETIRAYNRTVEALRLTLQRDASSESDNLLQFPGQNGGGV